MNSASNEDCSILNDAQIADKLSYSPVNSITVEMGLLQKLFFSQKKVIDDQQQIIQKMKIDSNLNLKQIEKLEKFCFIFH